MHDRRLKEPGWWPLLSRIKAPKGESLIGWLDDFSAAAARPAPVTPRPLPVHEPALQVPAPTVRPTPAPLPRAEPTPAPSADIIPLRQKQDLPPPPEVPMVAPEPEPAEARAPEPVSEPEPEPLAPPEAAPEPVAEAPPKPRESLFQRFARGLTRTAEGLNRGIAQIFSARKIDEASLEELEDLLITSDLGVAMAGRLTGRLRESGIDKETSDLDVRGLLAEEVVRVLKPAEVPFAVDSSHRPYVVLVVGVNGTGKTTTIGKLAHQLKASGRSVMIAAGDTFRAAAIDQLKIWGERAGAAVIARDEGADAAGLAFDALEAARGAGVDVLLIDTAGRLQNKSELMAELEKVIRVLKKLDPAAPHSVLQVLDATTGQNALSQVEAFHKTAKVTGLIMTKLDGTARGGILVPLTEKFGLPIHAIGVGEGVDDLQAFNAEAFARAIAGLEAVA